MTMFAQSLQEACRLNFIGATLLSRDDPNGAVSAFRTAVQLMEALSRTDEAIDQIRSNHEKMVYSMEVPDADEADSFFVFNKPLLFQVSPSAGDLGFYNAVIIYNLALTFHLTAIRRGGDSKFRKALHFYNLCADLLAQDETASSGTLLLAVLNNATHAHLQLGDYKEFRAGIEKVEKHAAQLTQRNASRPPVFEPHHFDELFLNITLAHEPTAAPMA